MEPFQYHSTAATAVMGVAQMTVPPTPHELPQPHWPIPGPNEALGFAVAAAAVYGALRWYLR